MLGKKETARKIRIRNQTAFIVNDKAHNHALINLKKRVLSKLQNACRLQSHQAP